MRIYSPLNNSFRCLITTAGVCFFSIKFECLNIVRASIISSRMQLLKMLIYSRIKFMFISYARIPSWIWNAVFWHAKINVTQFRNMLEFCILHQLQHPGRALRLTNVGRNIGGKMKTCHPKMSLFQQQVFREVEKCHSEHLCNCLSCIIITTCLIGSFRACWNAHVFFPHLSFPSDPCMETKQCLFKFSGKTATGSTLGWLLLLQE